MQVSILSFELYRKVIFYRDLMLLLRNLKAKAIRVEPFVLVDLLFAVDLESRFVLAVVDLSRKTVTFEYSTPISSLSNFCKQASFDLYS